MSLLTSLIRRTFKRSDDKRDAGLTTPADVLRRDDIAYGPDQKWQKLDVYRPRGLGGKLPVIVSVHGGGWVYGDKERYQYYCMDLARRGFAVVNFTYRLAPEYKFPAGIEDTNLVFSWVLENSEGFDTERIFAVGDSAGAHMLTLYSALCTNPGYADKLGIRPPRFKDGRPFVPAALGLNCGVYRISLGREANYMTRGLMRALMKHHGSAEEMDLINPLPYIGSAFPRAYIMTANQDPLAGPPAQTVLTQRLISCGVPFTDRTWGTAESPLGHVFHCDICSAAASQCNDEECAFFLAQAKEAEA